MAYIQTSHITDAAGRLLVKGYITHTGFEITGYQQEKHFNGTLSQYPTKNISSRWDKVLSMKSKRLKL